MSAGEENDGVLWRPESITRHEVIPSDRSAWSYILVEEVIGDVAEVHRYPWPLADADGRLMWTADDEAQVDTIVVPMGLLRSVLYRPDLERRPRAGDTFALKGDADVWRAVADDTAVTRAEDLRRLFTGQVFDVSADSRVAAQLARDASMVTIRETLDSGEESVFAAQDDPQRMAARLDAFTSDDSESADQELA